MANQLSKRIKAGKTRQIVMLFLHLAEIQSLIYKYKDQQIVTTTPAAGYPIPVYRLRLTGPDAGKNSWAERQ